MHTRNGCDVIRVEYLTQYLKKVSCEKYLQKVSSSLTIKILFKSILKIQDRHMIPLKTAAIEDALD